MKAQEREKYRENEQALDGGASNLYIGAVLVKKQMVFIQSDITYLFALWEEV